MSKCDCHVNARIVRYDGEAHLTKWMVFSRAPVAGDLIAIRDDTGDYEWEERVQRVTLVDEGTAWVVLKDNVLLDEFNYEDSDFCHGRRENIREAIVGHLQCGFEVGSIATLWIGGIIGGWVKIDEFWAAHNPLGELEYINGQEATTQEKSHT